MFQLDKIARNFGKSSSTYDDASFVQQEIGKRLIERLIDSKSTPTNILDLGCGTGFTTNKLAANFPIANIIGIDLSLEMVDFAIEKYPKLNFQQANALELPYKDCSFDLVFSNCMLQWIVDLSGLFKEVHRILTPTGKLIFSYFGPDTLHELRSSWAAIDSYSHVHDFIDMHNIGDELLRAKFINTVMDLDLMSIEYKTLHDLFLDLKKIGANNQHQNRNKFLTGKDQFQSMCEHYKNNYTRDDKFIASYEVIYGYASANQLLNRQFILNGEVHIPISSISKA